MNNEFDSKQRIDLREFIPQKIQSGRFGHVYDTHVEELEDHYLIYYLTEVHNKVGIYPAAKKYSDKIKKSVSRRSLTFEVLGLLQGEMSKTYNKTIIFANCEPNINREVMDWFSNELGITHDDWHWYIKVNINKPDDFAYQKQIEDKVISYWLKETKINLERRYPTTVSYIKHTVNKILRENDYGTLIIEYKSNIVSEIFKNFVKKITYEHLVNCKHEEIKSFMRGIIAAESTVEIHHPSMKYRVFITAFQKDERDIYQKCLQKLNIESKQYENYQHLVISKRKNNFKLLELDLMSLNPTKFRKFKELIGCYYPGEGYSETVKKDLFVKETSCLYAEIFVEPFGLS
jgi:hypothetical protein